MTRSERQAHTRVNYCPSRSSKVSDVGTDRKHVCIILFLLVVVDNLHSNFDPIWGRFKDTALKCQKSTNFIPHSYSAKIWCVPFGVDSWCWGLQREERLG